MNISFANNAQQKEIYLAGGCFWGVEKYFSEIPGVTSVTVGYANGNTPNPDYKMVCTGKSGYTEAVHITYDPKIIGLNHLLQLYFNIVDPTSLNKQGNDRGTQYRTGIYYTDPAEAKTIKDAIQELQKKYKEPIVIEAEPLKSYHLAEEYHQDYLDKNPNGYCHLPKALFETAKTVTPKPDPNPYKLPSKEELKKSLTPIQYQVTQEGATERPYENPYWNEKREGIYVDVTTGEPLFSSQDKFDACGWPSFSQPLNKSIVSEKKDTSHGMIRQEVIATNSDAHLGHVFNDGPTEKGGLRYCINSASLKFIPKDDMEKAGYGKYLYLFQAKDKDSTTNPADKTQNKEP